MTIYTSKVVAQHLNLTERRVRQLRDEGVIREKRPGLYDLVDTMTRYIKYIGAGSKADLNDERAKLTKEKRIAAETENRVNPEQIMTFCFDSGVVLKTPELTEEQSGSLPPWKENE